MEDTTHPQRQAGADRRDELQRALGERYELRRPLGAGGMGQVHLAWDRQLQREVALKTLHGADVRSAALHERFLREARAAARLRHPNLVPVFDMGQAGAVPYLTMAYIPGEPLSAPIARGETRGWEPRRTAAMVCKIARAIGCAHREGLLHRDIKPSNVLLDETGEPHVADFGLAREIERQEWTELTRTGAPVGTPGYMAPEQAAGKSGEIGPAADVWALGVTLYELLAGCRPFDAPGFAETLRRIESADPVPLRAQRREIDLDLQTICLLCLEKSPARRYPHADALADDLQRWLDGFAVAARPPGPTVRLARGVRRRPAPFALAAGLLLAGLVAGGFLARDELAYARALRQARAGLDRLRREAADPVAELAAARRALAAARALRDRTAIDRVERELATEEQRLITALGERIARELDDGDLQRARDRLLAAPAAWQADPRLMALRARADSRLRAIEEAHVAQRQALQIAGLLQGPFAEALDLVRRAALLHARGELATERGDLARKLERIRAGLSLDSATTRGFVAALAGHFYLLAGDRARGARELGDAITLAPDLPFGYLYRALDSLRRYEALRGLQLLRVTEEGAAPLQAPPEDARQRELVQRILVDIQQAGAARVRPGEGWVTAQLALAAGLQACLRGQYAAAEPLLRHAGDRLTDRLRREWLARCRVLLGRAGEALPLYEDLLRDVPRHAPLLGETAQCLILLARDLRSAESRPWLERAHQLITRAIQIEPRQPRWRVVRVFVLLLNGRLEQGRGASPGPSLDAALADLDAAEADGRALRATCLLDYAAWQRSTGADPRPRLDAALALLDELARAEPDSSIYPLQQARAWIERARWRLDRGEQAPDELARARQALERARRLDRAVPAALRARWWEATGIAQLHRRQDPTASLERAIAAWGELAPAPALHAQRAALRIRLALWRHEQGDDARALFEQALADYAAALALDPHHWPSIRNRFEARRLLATHLAARGGDPAPVFSAGIAELDRLVAQRPDSTPYLLSRAVLLENLAQHLASRKQDPRPALARALADLDRVLQLAPRLANAHYHRGVVWFESMRDLRSRGQAHQAAAEQALASFTRSIELAPADPLGHTGRGRLHLELGRHAEAVADLKRAVRLDPSPELLALLQQARTGRR